MNFPEKDKIFSELKKLLPEPTKIVVGVSGGPDSRLTFAVLSDFYEQNSWDQQLLIVAHFNHGQRKESDKEQQQIFKWYANYDIYYNDKKPKKGLKETALRNVRHEFFREVCKKEKVIYVGIGHNLDDRIETSFMNLLRGTGVKGLINMTMCDYNEEIFYLRPLIGLQKRYIQELCDVNKIEYFLDSSNKNSSLTIRNALRNDVFPQMSILSPQNRRYQSWSLIYSELERESKNKRSDRITLYALPLHKNWPVKSSYWVVPHAYSIHELKETDWIYVFQKLGIRKNVSQKTLAEWVRFSSNSADGHKFLSGVYFFISHGKLFAIDGAIDFREQQYDRSEKVPMKGETMKFDTRKIEIQPTRRGGVIRYVKPGDTYKGKRVKKRMINQKIPLFRRNLVPVVEKNGKIVDVIKDVVPAFYMK